MKNVLSLLCSPETVIDDDEEIQCLHAVMRQKKTERETIGEAPNFKYHENALPKLPPLDI